MTFKQRFYYVCALPALLLVAGCLQLPEPQPVLIRNFVLPNHAATVAADEQHALAPATIGLTLEMWPDYLHRKQLVLFASQTELKIFDDFLWAEPLRTAFVNRTLLILQRRYPQTQWQAAPWTLRPPDLLCVIEIHDWRAESTGQVSLSASWRIVERSSGAVLNSSDFTYNSTWNPTDFDDLAQVKSRQILALASAVEAAIAQSE